GELRVVRPHDLDDGIALRDEILERRGDLSAGRRVLLVGERRGGARAGLDDRLDLLRRELPDGLRDQRDAPLARSRFLGNPDLHSLFFILYSLFFRLSICARWRLPL